MTQNTPLTLWNPAKKSGLKAPKSSKLTILKFYAGYIDCKPHKLRKLHRTPANSTERHKLHRRLTLHTDDMER